MLGYINHAPPKLPMWTWLTHHIFNIILTFLTTPFIFSKVFFAMMTLNFLLCSRINRVNENTYICKCKVINLFINNFGKRCGYKVIYRWVSFGKLLTYLARDFPSSIPLIFATLFPLSTLYYFTIPSNIYAIKHIYTQ